MEKFMVDIIIPAFNEEQVLPHTFKRLNKLQKDLKKFGIVPFFIFVNDGSKDKTQKLLDSFVKRAKDYAIAIHFTTNFGHQAALKAGYDYALNRNKAKYVVSIDADLQDPPELIIDMIENAEKKHLDIVYAKRKVRQENGTKIFTADLFYKFINIISSQKLPEEVGDFRLVSMKILKYAINMARYPLFWRGIFAKITDNVGYVFFKRNRRQYGETKYSLTKMLNLAIAGILTMGDKVPVFIGYWAVVNIFALIIRHLILLSKFWNFIFIISLWSYILVILLLLLWYSYSIMTKNSVVYVIKEIVE